MPDTAAAVESAEIDSALYRAWLQAKASADRWTKALKEAEAVMRAVTSGAKVITVDGAPVARRVIRTAENVTWTSDYYRRLGDREGDDE